MPLHLWSGKGIPMRAWWELPRRLEIDPYDRHLRWVIGSDPKFNCSPGRLWEIVYWLVDDTQTFPSLQINHCWASQQAHTHTPFKRPIVNCGRLGIKIKILTNKQYGGERLECNLDPFRDSWKTTAWIDLIYLCVLWMKKQEVAILNKYNSLLLSVWFSQTNNNIYHDD